MEAKTRCKRLVIVEKESAMYQLHQEMAKMVERGNEKIDKIRQ